MFLRRTHHTLITSHAVGRVVASAVLGLLIAIAPRAADQKAPPCSLDTLPAEFHVRLDADFTSWKIQDSSSLSSQAKARWQDEKPLGCPGVAVGEFKRSNQVSYAVLLVPAGNSDAAYRLVVFTSSGGASPGTLETIDQWDNGGAANNFIHSVRIAKVFSPEWVRKLNVKTKEGVLSVDAGENEYGVDVYFWSDGQFRHEPIDY